MSQEQHAVDEMDLDGEAWDLNVRLGLIARLSFEVLVVWYEIYMP